MKKTIERVSWRSDTSGPTILIGQTVHIDGVHDRQLRYRTISSSASKSNTLIGSGSKRQGFFKVHRVDSKGIKKRAAKAASGLGIGSVRSLASEMLSLVQRIEATGGVTLVVETASGTRSLNLAIPEEGRVIVDPAMAPEVQAAVSRARLRGVEGAAAVLDGVDMLSGEEAAARMGVSRQAVHKAGKAGRLLALSGGGRSLKYPAWQFDEIGAPIEGLAELGVILGAGWPTFRFLSTRTEDGRPTYERLSVGTLPDVLTQARAAASGSYG